MNYDVDYFIKKFSAIPEEKWFVGAYNDGAGKHCALGHCGVIEQIGLPLSDWRMSDEGLALWNLCQPNKINQINDGIDQLYQQHTPKQRILAALYDIKAKQKPKETVRYVPVLTEITGFGFAWIDDGKHDQNINIKAKVRE